MFRRKNKAVYTAAEMNKMLRELADNIAVRFNEIDSRNKLDIKALKNKVETYERWIDELKDQAAEGREWKHEALELRLAIDRFQDGKASGPVVTQNKLTTDRKQPADPRFVVPGADCESGVYAQLCNIVYEYQHYSHKGRWPTHIVVGSKMHEDMHEARIIDKNHSFINLRVIVDDGLVPGSVCVFHQDEVTGIKGLNETTPICPLEAK